MPTLAARDFPTRTHVYNTAAAADSRTRWARDERTRVAGAPFPFYARRRTQPTKDSEPRGFWYAMNHQWLSYHPLKMRTRKYRTRSRTRYNASNVYTVVLPPVRRTTLAAPDTGKVLVLATERDLLAFTDTYGVRDGTTDDVSSSSEEDHVPDHVPEPDPPTDWYSVDWRKVARDFGGVEIPRYQATFLRKRANKTLDARLSWYSAWDVPSGVERARLAGHWCALGARGCAGEAHEAHENAQKSSHPVSCV